MSSTRLSAFLDGILEAGWLSAIVVTPLFFNIYSSRVFEPDKLTTLRSIALMMAAAWLARWVEERLEGKAEREQQRLSWRTPLMAPTLLTAAVYLLSTLFSITPYVSFFGSYQRLQGTFTTFSYIVIFLIILDRMRTRAQVDRFITTLILNSLPIALYGFVQHSQRDPLPWGGDVTSRIASNMGNPIFVAAYLIMAAFPTLARVVGSFRSILTEETSGFADILRASTYIFIFLVQVIAIWYTQSRGPLMGLLAGLAVWGFLGLMILQQTSRKGSPFVPSELQADLTRGVAFGAGTVGAGGAVAGLLYLAGRTFAPPGSSLPQWAAAFAALLVLLGVWMSSIVNQRGWRWLWISALMIAVLFAAGFLVINLVEPVHAWSQQQPWLGRLDDVLQAESGTGKVRALIWEGALQLILPHEPLQFPPTATDPEGHPDPFNLLRPLVGYGPESMYVAYNRFYPPLLGHYESRTASPDRSHNETLDSLVNTGLAGFAAYFWLFGSLFYFGLRWLGFLPADWRRTLFFILLPLGAIAAVAVVISTVGPHFFGLALPIGMVGGLLLYLLAYSFSLYWAAGDAPRPPSDAILLAGLLGAFVAHLVEINFGIAIASTRTTFWALAGVFVLVGMQWIGEEGKQPSPAPSQLPPAVQSRRKKKRRRTAPDRPLPPPSRRVPVWFWPSLGAALVGALILGTLIYDFTNNVERLQDPLQIFWRSLTVIAIPADRPRVSLGILMVLGMSWLSIGLLMTSQMIRQGILQRSEEKWGAGLVTLSISLLAGVLFGLGLAGRHAHIAQTQIQTITDALALAEYVAGQINAYYLFLFVVILAGGLALAGERPFPAKWGSLPGVSAAFVFLLLASVAAYGLNLRPIQADIIYKQADPWERQGQWAVAVRHYQRSAELAPREDFYYLYMGRAYLEYASSLEDPVQQDLVMRETERVLLKAQALNPLNTDHSANLARMYRRWASLPAGQQQAQTLAQLSSRYYEIATSLSPNNAILWNEWATLYHYELRDEEAFQRTIAHSLELDPEFEQTWLVVGDSRVEAGDLEGAAEAYSRALEILPTQPRVWNALGRVYLQLGRSAEAAEALVQALEQDPYSSEAWDVHRLLAIAYYQLGLPDQALMEAQIALQMAPEDQRSLVESLVQQLQPSPQEGEGP